MRSDAVRRVAPALLLLLALGAGAQNAAGPLPGAPASRLVFLNAGPRLGRGLPFLGPNVVEYVYGEYDYEGLVVGVHFTRESVPVMPGWRPLACAGTAAYSLGAAAGTLVFSPGEAGWSVFVSFPPGADWCAFLAPFLERLGFFARAAAAGPLPAVIELGGPIGTVNRQPAAAPR